MVPVSGYVQFAPASLLAALTRGFVEQGLLLHCPGTLGRDGAVANLVEVDGELGGVERPALAQVLTRVDDSVPGLELRHGYTYIVLRKLQSSANS